MADIAKRLLWLTMWVAVIAQLWLLDKYANPAVSAWIGDPAAPMGMVGAGIVVTVIALGVTWQSDVTMRERRREFLVAGFAAPYIVYGLVICGVLLIGVALPIFLICALGYWVVTGRWLKERLLG